MTWHLDEPPVTYMPPGCDALCDCCGDPCDRETGTSNVDDHVLCASCGEEHRAPRLVLMLEAAE